MPYPLRIRPTSSTLGISVPDKPASRYVWRDPARLTAAEIQALADHDAHVRYLERSHGGAGKAARGAVVQLRAERQARITAFTRFRNEDMSIADAAAAVGVSRGCGLRYERVRKGLTA